MDIAAGVGGGGTPPFPPLHKKTWGIHYNHNKFFLNKKIIARPIHLYHSSYRLVSLWFLVKFIEIYQMTYRYRGIISLPYTLKLLVYTLDGHSRWHWGGVPLYPFPSSPTPP